MAKLGRHRCNNITLHMCMTIPEISFERIYLRQIALKYSTHSIPPSRNITQSGTSTCPSTGRSTKTVTFGSRKPYRCASTKRRGLLAGAYHLFDRRNPLLIAFNFFVEVIHPVFQLEIESRPVVLGRGSGSFPIDVTHANPSLREGLPHFPMEDVVDDVIRK
ncbi:hypothetical protein AVEN_17578-1 [Araneus ventricosus]|uniref:Uncharacterized protein n=1 Tax=Araneus ventricosus TaxID=182803 RepID=A0A4Y2IYD0_ARAVE|nr:hypothetical protein AVEN_17578-1 [Araneus ventricosus]